MQLARKFPPHKLAWNIHGRTMAHLGPRGYRHLWPISNTKPSLKACPSCPGATAESVGASTSRSKRPGNNWSMATCPTFTSNC